MRHIRSVFTIPWLYVGLVLAGTSLFIGITYMSATPGDPEPISVNVFMPGGEPAVARSESSPLHAVHIFYVESNRRASIHVILRSPNAGEAWVELTHAARKAVATDVRCTVRCSPTDERWPGTEVGDFTVFRVPVSTSRRRELVIPLDRPSFQSTYSSHEIGVRLYNIKAVGIQDEKLLPKSGYQILEEEWTFDGEQIPGIDQPQFIGGRADLSDVRLDTRLLSGNAGDLSRLMYVRWTDLRQASRRDFMLFVVAALLGLGGSAFFEVMRTLFDTNSAKTDRTNAPIA